MFAKAALYLSAVSAVVLMPGVLSGQITSVSPSSVSFGDLKINSRSVQKVVIGFSEASFQLPFFGIRITGTDAADFGEDSYCNPLGGCQVFVVFTPRLPGAKTASVEVSLDNWSTIALSVPVAGNAVLTGSFEIVSALSAKVLDIANNSASDGTPIEQNSLDGLAQQRWRLLPVDGDYYAIVNLVTGKVLDVTGESTEDGARIQEYDYWGGANQQWLLVPVDDVHFAITNRLSGKALDLTNGSALNGTPIQQWDYVGNPQQLWVLLPAESYNIGAFLSGGEVLDVTNGSDLNGALIQQWSSNGYGQQQWQLLPVSGGYYAILNRLTGKVLDDTNHSTSNGTVIQQWDYLGGQNQHWQISPVALQISEDFAQLGYKIANELSGKVLDVKNRSTSNGALIQQWDYLQGPNQQWLLMPIPSYNIANVFSNLVLDVPGGSTANGTFIQQWSSNGNLQQQWQVIKGNSGYVIVNSLTGKVLEVAANSTSNGARIDQSDLVGADNQLWQLTSQSSPDGSTYWEIVNKHSGKALDDTDFSVSSGTLLQQWDYLGATNQLWQLVPVSN